jgi:hypothetical protein
MALLGTLLKKGLKIHEMLEQEVSHPFELQRATLKDLLINARHTEFGKHYHFSDILKSFKKGLHRFYDEYKNNVPIHTYNKMYGEWWHMARSGKKDVCWPGKVKYFALSSGTSESASKYIPVTKDMKRAIQKTSIRQILTVSHYDLPTALYETGILMIGGSTNLSKKGNYFEGDLSGIQAAKLPFWFQHFYKPGKKIARTREWDVKIDEIVKNAINWDIGILVGVPAWVQIMLDNIIAHYNVKSIHEIWPNLSVYVHSGVSIEPYRAGFDKLFSKPVHYINTYLASEGFVAFQAYPKRNSMRIILNNGIFYEFVPFNEKNFDADGEIKPDAEALMIDQIEEGKDYALLLSTCAGSWRYLLGDVIRFTSIEESEIIITGRTKHYLSLCGEHLSVDNMNRALEIVCQELGIEIPEFTVAGVPHGNLFAHHWYLGTDDKADPIIIKNKLDQQLKLLNDDYAVERKAALKDVQVNILPLKTFYGWMESKGKMGGQHKFPRVLKRAQLEDWRKYLSDNHHAHSA